MTPRRPSWPHTAPASAFTATQAERRRLITGTGLIGVGLAAGWLGVGSDGPARPAAAAATVDSARFTVDVQTAQVRERVQRGLLGSNVQWVDRGDDLLREDGSPEPRMQAAVQAVSPTVLRFPGGAQSDVYHWQRGLGAQAQRPAGEHFHARTPRPSTMGTVEFLTLCASTGATPLITVNVPTGTPDEAARWLHATNVVGMRDEAGRALPRVPTWEIGNEPYLKDADQPDTAMEPEAFARKADAIIRALRAVDGSIRIGLPVSNQQRNGIPVVHYADWLGRMLGTLTERVDFVSVHNGYMPFVQEPDATRDQAYWAAMAGAESVRADLALLRRALGNARPGWTPPIALTEYHAIFSLGRGARDEWTGSAAGALYIADLLCMLARQPDVLMANLWSLSGNWRFGAVHGEGFLRPAGEVLALMNQALRGRLVDMAVQAPEVAVAAAGLVTAQPAMPLLTALAVRADEPAGRVLRLVLLNKHPTQSLTGAVRLDAELDAPMRDARLTQLVAGDVMRADDVPNLLRRDARRVTAADLQTLTLPPASVTLLELPVRPARATGGDLNDRHASA